MRLAKAALLGPAVIAGGCGTLLPLAAKAAAVYFFPFLLFVSTDPPASSEPGRDGAAEDAFYLALDRARDPGAEGLSSGFAVLDVELRGSSGERLVVHALPVEGEDPGARPAALLEELLAEGRRVRVAAFDAGPMIDDPESARERIAALEASGVRIQAEGPLADLTTRPQ